MADERYAIDPVAESIAFELRCSEQEAQDVWRLVTGRHLSFRDATLIVTGRLLPRDYESASLKALV